MPQYKILENVPQSLFRQNTVGEFKEIDRKTENNPCESFMN